VGPTSFNPIFSFFSFSSFFLFLLQPFTRNTQTPLELSTELGARAVQDWRGKGRWGEKEEEDAGRVGLALTRPEEGHSVLSTASDIAGGDMHAFRQNDGPIQRICVSMSMCGA